MTTTYSALKTQIESLQRKAEAARKKEVTGVIDRIQLAIKAYGITAADLGLARGSAAVPSKSTKTSPSKAAKFGDDSGNTWVGRGPHPLWLREAIKAGKTLDEFRLGTVRKKAAKKAKSKRAGKKVAPKYDDGAGNTWSGRGNQPRWLVAALADGKTLESMKV